MSGYWGICIGLKRTIFFSSALIVYMRDTEAGLQKLLRSVPWRTLNSSPPSTCYSSSAGPYQSHLGPPLEVFADTLIEATLTHTIPNPSFLVTVPLTALTTIRSCQVAIEMAANGHSSHWKAGPASPPLPSQRICDFYQHGMTTVILYQCSGPGP